MTSASRYQQVQCCPVFTADCDPGFGSFLHIPGLQPRANQRAAALAIKPDLCNTGGPCGLAAASFAHGLRGEALRDALHRVSQTAGICLHPSGRAFAVDGCRGLFAGNRSGRAISAEMAARSSGLSASGTIVPSLWSHRLRNRIGPLPDCQSRHFPVQ